MKQKLAPYLPGILLFLLMLIIGLIIFRDYGMSWDEPAYRQFGLLSYDYIYGFKKELQTVYFTGFELPLVYLEKWLKLTDPRDIYLLRHIVTHVLFLVGALSAYILAFRLFRKRSLACLAFVMLVLTPRIYAHSFFNSRDVPFLSLFVITLMLAQLAFEKRKVLLFFVLGLSAGYTTSVRIMGVMLGAFLLSFLFIDLLTCLRNKEKPTRNILSILLFLAGFGAAVSALWPYLWHDPFAHFRSVFTVMAHYNNWGGMILLNGKFWQAGSIPAYYFPEWFLISNPIVWLAAGAIGMLYVAVDFIKRPLTFLGNTNERNFLLYLLCFTAPVLSVMVLHSIIYDDWRHLYFIYPSFVFMGLYFIDRALQSKLRRPVQALFILQIVIVAYFMVRNHPYQQVYFNELVSHEKEYLQDNFDMDYWGCSYKQGLEHLLETEKRDVIRMKWAVDPLPNNILMLPPKDRARVIMVDSAADYLITNFRDIAHGKYKELTPFYTISVLNSRIMSIYKLH